MSARHIGNAPKMRVGRRDKKFTLTAPDWPVVGTGNVKSILKERPLSIGTKAIKSKKLSNAVRKGNRKKRLKHYNRRKKRNISKRKR